MALLSSPFARARALGAVFLGGVLLFGCSSEGDSGGGGTQKKTERVSCADVKHEVVPVPSVAGVGPDYLGDADTDDNGISDRDEWGSLEFAPVDTDEDGTPDYQDVDDDGDGLVDVNDAERTEALSVTDELGLTEKFGMLSNAWTELPTGAAPRAARPGDHLIVSGTGLSCDALVAFEGGAETKNAWPVSASDTEVEVVVPEGAGDGVAVIQDGVRSNTLTVSVVDAGAPLVFELSPASAAVGSTLELTGVDLSGVTSVFFGSTEVAPTAKSASSVQVVVPADASADVVRVSAGDVSSNAVFLRTTTPATVKVTAPSGITPTRVVYGPEQEVPLGADGTAAIEIAARGLRTIDVFAGDQGVLQALSAPGMSEVTVDASSTAVALAVQASGAAHRISPESLEKLLQIAAPLSATQALAAAVEADPASLWTAPSAELSALIYEAASSVQTEVDAAVAAGTLATPQAAPSPVAGPIPMATIDPSGPQADISVTQTQGTPNISVDNDTQLNVSVKVWDTERKVALQDHSGWGYGKSVVGGQTPITFLFTANHVDLDQPRGRDSRVEIVTPGILSPQPTDPLAVKTQRMLQLRTVMEKVIWPILTTAIEVKVNPKILVELFKAHAPGATADFFDNMNKGAVTAAVKVVVNAFIRDAQNVGPLVRGAVGFLAAKAGPKVIEYVAKRFAKNMVPVLNALDAALSAASTAIAAIDALKAAADLGSTPGQLEWSVLFDLGISKLSPLTIKKLDVDVSNVELWGNQFYPKFENGKYVIPTVTFTDKGATGFGTYLNDRSDVKFFISSDGTRIDHIRLPAYYVRTAVGPIEVRVDKGSDSAVAPDDIKVLTDFELTKLEPATGVADDHLTVTGKGFANDVHFEFREANVPEAQAQLVDATLVSHTDTSAEIIVPQLPAGKKQWLVRAYQNGALGVRSNGLLFVVKGGAYQLVPIGTPTSGEYGEGVAVNEKDEVLGIAWGGVNSGGKGRVFIWSQAKGIQIQPDATATNGELLASNVYGLSDNGDIIGTFNGGILYTGGAVKPLSQPASPVSGWTCSQALSTGAFFRMTPGGKLVGTANCGAGGFTPVGYAATWEPAALLAPGFSGPNTSNTEAHGMNGSGMVVGCADFTPLRQAAVFSGGTAQQLQTVAEAPSSCAMDVNDSGVIVGSGGNGTTKVALMWPSAGAAPVTFPNAPIGGIIDINNAGVMLAGPTPETFAYAPVYVSDDGGATWTKVGGDPVDVGGVTYAVTRAYAINDNGVIAATAAMGSFGTLVPVALVPSG